MNLAEVPSTVRPQGQAWAVFYLPFLIALCYFVVMEQELETELYEPFTRGLSKRKRVIEYILRALCALFLALPQNLWVKGSNISRMEAFGFFAFPR